MGFQDLFLSKQPQAREFKWWCKMNGCSGVGKSRSRASTSETGRWLGKGASQRRPANEGINKRLAKAADKEGQRNNPRPRSIIDEVREIAMPG
jgi:hypothetical protein